MVIGSGRLNVAGGRSISLRLALAHYIVKAGGEPLRHDRGQDDASLEFRVRPGKLRTEKKNGFLAGSMNLAYVGAEFRYARIEPAFRHLRARVALSSLDWQAPFPVPDPASGASLFHRSRARCRRHDAAPARH